MELSWKDPFGDPTIVFVVSPEANRRSFLRDDRVGECATPLGLVKILGACDPG